MSKPRLQSVISFLQTCIELLTDVLLFARSWTRSRTALAAEVLFLRKQLAFYEEREVEPRRLDAAARISMVLCSKLFDWKNALVIVKSETLIGWHRKGFKLFWRWKCKHGRPRLPKNIRSLIAQMVRENPIWGQARVAHELSLKLGIYVSPRTVRRYWPKNLSPSSRKHIHPQRWRTFVHNHAKAILACDFMVVITARFRIVYVLVLMEVGSRRLLCCNATAHPTAEWTFQQLREAISDDNKYKFLIHDRDSIFTYDLEQSVRLLGVRSLKTPVQTPQANAFCERLIGTIRRECLDYLIPLNERHIRLVLREWMEHYNHGRPHRALGPGLPTGLSNLPRLQQTNPHSMPRGIKIKSTPILGGLHHEYSLDGLAA